MRRWGIASNCIYRKASLHMEEGHWGYFLLDEVVGRICGKVPAWPKLPSWPSFWMEGEWTNPRDWWGDPHQLFHLYVCTRVFEWTQEHLKHYDFNLDYDEVEDQIGDDWCVPCRESWSDDPDWTCYGTKKGDPIPEKYKHGRVQES